MEDRISLGILKNNAKAMRNIFHFLLDESSQNSCTPRFRSPDE